MRIIEALPGIFLSCVFVALGLYSVFLPRRIQKEAQEQRPKNWRKIIGLNLIWAWIDDPSYVPTIFVMGLASISVGLFALLLIIASLLHQ